MVYQLIATLEDTIESDWQEDSEKLARIGDQIYEKVKRELEQHHYGKYAVIIPGAQCVDHKHRVIVTDPPVGKKRRLDIILEVQKDYPGSVPYLRFIGKPEDNPAPIRLRS